MKNFDVGNKMVGSTESSQGERRNKLLQVFSKKHTTYTYIGCKTIDWQEDMRMRDTIKRIFAQGNRF